MKNIIKKAEERFRLESIDKTILVTAFILLVSGFFAFLSASVGFLNKSDSEEFFGNFVKLQVISYLIGFLLLLVFYFLDLKLLKKIAAPLYVFSIFLNLLIFIPGLELAHDGGVRWLNIFGFSMQPADILKLGAILFFASYFFNKNSNLRTLRDGVLLPALYALPIVIIFFMQKDLGNLFILLFILGTMYFVDKNSRLSFMVIFVLAASLVVSSYIYTNSYVIDRVTGLKEESYQTKQSLIALGSGGLFGRGYGQGIQKFYHLPEPAGDSIFAATGEEIGFVGMSIITLLFATLIIKTFWLSYRTEDDFNKSVLLGISILFFVQFFINTGSMTRIIPLSGDILPLFSKGGTALMMNMLELGLLLKLTRKDIIQNKSKR